MVCGSVCLPGANRAIHSFLIGLKDISFNFCYTDILVYHHYLPLYVVLQTWVCIHPSVTRVNMLYHDYVSRVQG